MRNPVTQIEGLAVLGAVGVLVWLGWKAWPSLQSLVNAGNTVSGWANSVSNWAMPPDPQTLVLDLTDFNPGLAPLTQIQDPYTRADAYSLWSTLGLDALTADFPLSLPSDPSTAGMDSHTKTLMDYLRGQ